MVFTMMTTLRGWANSLCNIVIAKVTVQHQVGEREEPVQQQEMLLHHGFDELKVVVFGLHQLILRRPYFGEDIAYTI